MTRDALANQAESSPEVPESLEAPVVGLPEPASGELPQDDSGSGIFTLTLESAAGPGGAMVRQEKRLYLPDPTYDPLLRVRLQAAAGFFAVILALALAWLSMTTSGVALALQGVLVLVMVLLYGFLSGDRVNSGRQLRALEFVVFGCAAAFLALRQFQAMRTWAALEDPFLLLLSVKTSLVATVLLIFAYCMFIPNTWRSAIRIVPVLAIAPAITEGVLYLTHPDAMAIVQRVATRWRVVEDVGLVLIASILAIYGSHVIQTLRREARAARELNQYRLVKRLGTGGMGEVYLAEHQLLKRPCAVKLIRHDSAADPIELTRFEREVRATARLSHPNTVEVYDYGRTDEGTFYYVMEYLRGLSLEEIVKRHGPMPPGRVIYLIRQVCGALAEAHAAGLVHRDVKPANIFASVRGGRRDVAKLLDFGLVKGPALGVSGEPMDARREGMIRGTPLYMAPEQVVADADVDLRCDIYALGGVAYRLLTGSPPFDRDSRTEVLSAHAHEPVIPPRSRRPDLPEDLEQIILRCLDKSPSARFQSVTELSEALARCSAAPDWDADRAASWWAELEPEAVAPMSPLS